MPKPFSRRQFLKVSASAAAATALLGTSCQFSHDFDLLIVGGIVLDGSGKPGTISDLGIRKGRITAIGNLKDRSAKRKIDAGGLAVAPGFIDFHSHSDDELLLGGQAQSKVRQGVTTEVLGQDGDAMAPLNDKMHEMLQSRMQSRYGISVDWRDFDGYFRQLESGGMITNAISMVGQGALREYVIGNDDRPASDDELAQMILLAKQSFAQGAFGISSGLEYVPSSFASTDELIALCRAMNGHGIYSTHMRSEDERVVEAVAEAIHIAREAQIPLNISHIKASGQRNWQKLPEMKAMMDQARAEGMTISCDRYPYIAYNTGLSSLFPLWSRDGGREKFVERLQEPTLKTAIRNEVLVKIERLGGWQAVMVSSLPHNPERKRYEGERLNDLTPAKADTYDFLVELVLGENGGGDMVGFAMSEDNTADILKYPYCMTASDASSMNSDGVLRRGNPHPRAYGTFPRLLGHYVREKTLLPLPEAIRKISALPAEMLGFSDRGMLREGFQADIAVFDPQTVADRATWKEPHQYPVGIPYVIVNGIPVIDNDKYTGKLPGRIIRGDVG